jgi:hypothetical protein
VSNADAKVEFISQNGIIEIRYFDTPKDELYRSWKLPEAIVEELIIFWKSTKKNRKGVFPLQRRTKICEFIIHTERFIEIKSLDIQGRTSMIGWSLPNIAVEGLIKWNTKEK